MFESFESACWSSRYYVYYVEPDEQKHKMFSENLLISQDVCNTYHIKGFENKPRHNWNTRRHTNAHAHTRITESYHFNNDLDVRTTEKYWAQKKKKKLNILTKVIQRLL